MTKLVEWLMVLLAFFTVYFAIVARKVQHDVLDDYMYEIMLSPLILLALFGAFSAAIVLYRTFTFNNCEEAAKELLEQIKEAKEDLRSKGMTFTD
ncbi:dolichol-phosphate mannosyltransferase subunit 3 [Topomyia yanbarensis]|uniref:dolichol-phosphate mannosyltransferase subunit 3 n=1 Tax=Topomyia yanbarensis TaxID=2498891 RepID=UPI00273C1A16|nr:dolichol-phosphate mannosyltransferase subunit 3 [Topomyia yanbarensis]